MKTEHKLERAHTKIVVLETEAKTNRAYIRKLEMKAVKLLAKIK